MEGISNMQRLPANQNAGSIDQPITYKMDVRHLTAELKDYNGFLGESVNLWY